LIKAGATVKRLRSIGDAARSGVGCNAMGKYERPAWAKKFYGSRAWRECRDAYTASRGGLCERCLEKGTYSPGDVVHHIEPLNAVNINDPTISLCWDNLMLLCTRCHAEIHSGKRWQVDEYGRIT